MKTATLFLVPVALLSLLGPANAQQTEPASKPSVVVENNRSKPKKDSPFRLIQGVVKDQQDNPVAGAIVQLKNIRNSKVVDFATKDDGKFAFRDLAMGDDYELLAKRGDLISPLKKVSIYDIRKEVVINFKLEPRAKQ